MKRVTLLIILLSVIITGNLKAQVLTLQECQKLAEENYPILVQRGLISRSEKANIANVRRNWLPQLSLSAQATYQSDVMTFPEQFNSLLALAGIEFEGIPRDQYRVGVELQQIIWDGGIIAAQVGITKAEADVSRQTWEVEMYGLRERVNGIYFGALLLQENIKLAELYICELERNLALVNSYLDNGVAGTGDAEKVRVEILTAKQKRSELTSSLAAYHVILGLMTGFDITSDTELAKPEIAATPEPVFDNRPELKLLDAQDALLQAQRKGINAGLMPKIGAFAQFGYGNPGLNLFEDMGRNQWSTYYIVGAKLEWKIGGFYTRKNKLSLIDTGRDRISSNREAFLYNMRLKNAQENVALMHIRDVMLDDDEIIALRRSISARTEKQVAEGVVTVSDLLRDITQENIARQNKATHEIELLKNLYDIKYTTNN